MSRATELLGRAADALDDGRNPLCNPFLSDNEVTLDECYDLAENLAAGAVILCWLLENPAKARVALSGAMDAMKLESVIAALGRPS